MSTLFKKHLQNSDHKRFLANTGWMVGERVYQMAISMVVGVLTARYLGPTNYGLVNYVAAFVTFAIPICSLGLEGILIKRLVDNPADAGRDLGTSIVMRLFVSFFSSLAIISIVAVLNPGDRLVVIVALLQTLALFFRSFEVIEYWYQSRLQSKYASIAKIIGYTVMSMFRVYLLISEKSVPWFAFALSIDAIVVALLYLILYKRHDGSALGWNWQRGKDLLSQSHHFILSGLVVVLYSQMDKILIQQMKGNEQVGLYAAAYAVASLWFFVPLALINSARPVIMNAKANDEILYLRRLKQLYSVIFWLGIFVGLAISWLAKPIILLLYGEDFGGAENALIIIVWYGVFAQLGSARGIWILCERKHKYVKTFVIIGAVVNIILNLNLIPVFGIEGAAVTTLITQVFVSLIAPLLYKETRIHTKYVLQAIFFKW